MAEILSIPPGKVSSASDAINFSYDCICSNLTIPQYQQMIVYDLLIIQEGSELRVDGKLILEV